VKKKSTGLSSRGVTHSTICLRTLVRKSALRWITDALPQRRQTRAQENKSSTNETSGYILRLDSEPKSDPVLSLLKHLARHFILRAALSIEWIRSGIRNAGVVRLIAFASGKAFIRSPCLVQQVKPRPRSRKSAGEPFSFNPQKVETRVLREHTNHPRALGIVTRTHSPSYLT